MAQRSPIPIRRTAIPVLLVQNTVTWSYQDLAEDSNASLGSTHGDLHRSHSNFSVASRATSVASLISRTHSTFLAKHKKFSLKRKSLWAKVGFNYNNNIGIIAITTRASQGVDLMHTLS